VGDGRGDERGEVGAGITGHLSEHRHEALKAPRTTPAPGTVRHRLRHRSIAWESWSSIAARSPGTDRISAIRSRWSARRAADIPAKTSANAARIAASGVSSGGCALYAWTISGS
jgi:hypothetical protein